MECGQKGPTLVFFSPNFSLKRKGYCHLSTLCVYRERNCTLCAYTSMQKVSQGTENME